MHRKYSIPIWKSAPFLRLLPALIIGILLQWYVQLSFHLIITSSTSFLFAYLLFSFLPVNAKFLFMPLRGVLINLLLICAGAWFCWQKDIRHNNNWYGNYFNDSSYLIVHIDEPVIEKTKSYKADGMVEAIVKNGAVINCSGKLLLYFSKDSTVKSLKYGDRILVKKSLQPIKNSGNPGAFNYKRYAAFQQIFHNVYLKENNWIRLPGNNSNWFWRFIFFARDKTLAVLQKYINGSKDELGIAEALLIGYTNDLDKDLVQAYSNTGVVHIIAISGMHLGLIYLLLVLIFSKIPFINQSKILQLLLILTCLWLFSLLTGGAASVIRSAVMFSFISMGKTFFKQASTFNALAASAFVMLCYNPYYLWDVGFQLSYLAVVGIVIFQRPIYNLFFIKNKWLDKTWQLMSVALAAQLLTFPVCIYYFHQFPLFFLITNMVAVPLSTIILYAEIFLVAFAWLPYVGLFAGKITTALLWTMNKFIVWVNGLPFSVLDKISANVSTTWLLYAVVIFMAAWLLSKNKKLLQTALGFLALFSLVHSLIAWQIKLQQKLIVYNVPQLQAIDFVNGKYYQFVGDSVLLQDGLLQNFHLKPARIALQLNNKTDSITGLFKNENFYQYGNKRIFIVDESITIKPLSQKIAVDVLVISKNPKISIAQIAKVFNCGKIVFDASNSLWKIEQWKQQCDELNLRHHSIPQQGAFVMDID